MPSSSTYLAIATALALVFAPDPARADAGPDGGASDTAPAPDGGVLADVATIDAGASDGAPDAALAVNVEATTTTSAAEPAAEVTAEAAPAPPKGFFAELFGLPGEWSSKGELGIEGRVFQDDDRRESQDQGLGLLGRLELRHSHGAFDEKVRVFGRLDRYDADRSTLTWEEAFLQASSERVRVRAGLDIVNWTATEAFHPADVINARNFDSDLENLEKIGEPMLAVMVRPFEETTLTLLAMPYRSKPVFASQKSRLNFEPTFDLRSFPRLNVDRKGRPTERNWGPQGAVMLRQVIGPADLSLHALEHVDRTQPLVRFEIDFTTGQPRPYLVFQTVQQLGGTYQHAIGPLLVKLEGAYRHFIDPKEALPGFGIPNVPYPNGLPDHGQLAIGLEWGTTHEAGAESTFLLEGQTVLGVSGELQRSALSVFQRDVLVGYRFALNDEDGKELLFGFIFDADRSSESLINASYQQRLGETWTMKAGLRIFRARADSPSALARLREADHVRLSLTRHF